MKYKTLVNLTTKALALPRTKKILIAVLIDTFCCVFSVWLALCLRLSFLTNLNQELMIAGIISVTIAIPTFFVCGLYKVIFRFVNKDALGVLAKATIIYTLLSCIIFIFIKVENIPRSIGLMQPMIFFVLVSTSRSLVRFWLRNYNNLSLPNKKKEEVIIYGANISGQQLASNLRHSNKFKLLYFIDNDRNLWGGTIDGYYVRAPSCIKEISKFDNIKHLWIADPKISGIERKKLLNLFRGLPLHVRSVSTFTNTENTEIQLKDLKELDFNDLLDRVAVKPNGNLLKKCINEKIVLITGAGGSIGSEICRQIISNNPKTLLLLENSEIALYKIHSELTSNINSNNKINTTLVPLLINIQDENKLDLIFKTWHPDTVYHAAAYKHVSLVEHNVIAGITNNVFGTLKCAQAAVKFKVKHFVLVSTDKAVRPTNIMGASKRLAEIALQVLNDDLKVSLTKLCIVRFGNVIGSSGSVAPLFKKQIESGGPVTVTDKKVTRYFMTIPEAAQLVIQAGGISKGGEVFILDMGKPVKILDLARRMIESKGLQVKDKKNPLGDIEIKVNGLKPGEKLYEELLIGNDPKKTEHPRIMQARETFMTKKNFQRLIEELNLYIIQNDVEKIISVLKENMTDFQPIETNIDLVTSYIKNKLN